MKVLSHSPILLILAALIPADALVSPNQVAGVWNMTSAAQTVNGTRNDNAYGAGFHGTLIFTRSGYFAAQVNRGDMQHFPGDTVSSGTSEDFLAVGRGVFGSSGTYKVDRDGAFAGEHVLGCTFPNWQGTYKGNNELSYTASGNGQILHEHVQESEYSSVDIMWERLA